MSTTKNKKQIMNRSALLKLTKEKLVDMISGVKPTNISLKSIDKESLKILKSQWNKLTNIMNNSRFPIKITINANITISSENYNTFGNNFHDDNICVFITDDKGFPVLSQDLEKIIFNKNDTKIQARIKKINIELNKTRSLVVKIAEKAKIDPEMFWSYLELNYLRGIPS